MFAIVPFQPEHLAALRLQSVQSSAQRLMTAAHGREILAQRGLALTVLRDGAPISAGGIMEIWRGRAYAWSYLSDLALVHMKWVHRAAFQGLQQASWSRIEMAIDPAHHGAKLWAAHLGFDFECLARKWTMDGRDAELWARVAP